MGEQNLFSMMTGSGLVVQLVLILLVVLSIWSWAIVISKSLQLKKIKALNDEFSDIFWETKNFARIDDSARRLEDSPLTKLFTAGYREILKLIQDSNTGTINRELSEKDLATVESVLKRAELEESEGLEKGVTFLATTASAAPFIGLFGTVWGIMNAFHGLSSAKSTTIQAVAPGISEALVATAVGLAAAIPAAVAYNFFSVNVKRIKLSMNRFSGEFITLAKRSFSK